MSTVDISTTPVLTRRKKGFDACCKQKCVDNVGTFHARWTGEVASLDSPETPTCPAMHFMSCRNVSLTKQHRVGHAPFYRAGCYRCLHLHSQYVSAELPSCRQSAAVDRCGGRGRSRRPACRIPAGSQADRDLSPLQARHWRYRFWTFRFQGRSSPAQLSLQPGGGGMSTGVSFVRFTGTPTGSYHSDELGD